jgi:uncharacterized membrane protein YhaH (DUF805 family)
LRGDANGSVANLTVDIAMTWQQLLFSFKGRIGRGTYWLSILPVLVAVHFIAFVPLLIVNLIVGMESDEMPDSFLFAVLAAQLIWLAGLWPLLAVGSKRLHDRDKRGWWLPVFWFLPFFLFFGGFGHAFTSRTGDTSTGEMMMLASLPIALWGIVELGILPGTKGPNRFGDDPVQRAT